MAFANGVADGSLPDYQLAAWLMAAYLRPLSMAETADLTRAMAHSGQMLNLAGLPRPWMDKHSTGGVGDKTTLVLLPLLAAGGLSMVKMSGRGLGITGGTVDKLESVPGFRLDLSPEEMTRQAASIGLALTGQTPNLAPADKKLYALRDVTATVASMPLIVSSILSKKLAGGADHLVLDVKCGSGAFMRTREEAEALASALVETAVAAGLPTRAAISDMSQPLGAMIGNAVEVLEALDVLENRSLSGPALRFRELCVELAAVAFEFAGKVSSAEAGRSRAKSLLEGGAAAAKAELWFRAQSGKGLAEARAGLKVAPVAGELVSPRGGWIKRLDAGRIGQAVVDMGGGRARKDDAIDHAVGIEVLAKVGDWVDPGQPLLRCFGRAVELGGALEVVDSELPSVPPIFNWR
jgi:pyrimidine-nucleoside phosphorylase